MTLLSLKMFPKNRITYFKKKKLQKQKSCSLERCQSLLTTDIPNNMLWKYKTAKYFCLFAATNCIVGAIASAAVCGWLVQRRPDQRYPFCRGFCSSGRISGMWTPVANHGTHSLRCCVAQRYANILLKQTLLNV